MNVLVVTSKYPPEYAGSGLRAHHTYKRLARKYGISFDVVTGSMTSNRSEAYPFEGVRITRIANKAYKIFKRKPYKALWKRLLQGIRYRWYWQVNYWREAIPMFLHLLRHGTRYDAIHIFGNATVTAVAITYAKITGKPLIVELVNLKSNPNQYEPGLFSRLFGKGFPKQTLLVCLSEALKKVCREHGYPDGRIWHRPNPVPEARFNYTPARKTTYPFTWPDLAPSDTLIVQIAKFRPLKNQRFMVDVLAHLPDSYKLLMAGPLVESGPQSETEQAYFQTVRDTIEAHGLERRVHLIPSFVKNPEAFMKVADIYVVPSTSEAFGTPCFEALACGVPVVVTHLPGVFDQWIRPGVNGYTCPFDPAVWAEKIQLATRIPEKARQEASEAVLSVASTKAVDRSYFERLSTLTGRS